MQDPDARLNAVPMFNGDMHMPGMGHMHKRDKDPKDVMVDLEWLAPPIKLLEAHDQLGGNNGLFCYVYV